MALAAIFLGLALMAAQDPPPAQQTPATPPQETPLEGIEVIGQPLQRMVEAFVEDVIAPPPGRGPSRWDRKVCVGVSNLRRETAQAIVDRVSEVALDVGLEIGDPGCRANILIIATDDGPGMARALVQRAPNSFRPRYAGAAQSAQALERFQTTEAAVRWWHVGMPVQSHTGEPAVRLPGENAPVIRQAASRLRTEVENVLLRAFIIVDLERAGEMPVSQLADYVAMVALAQVNPDSDLRAYPTVLNAFTDVAAATALTDWDRSYLTALYDAELNQRNPDWQINETGWIMFREREAEQQAGEEPAED